MHTVFKIYLRVSFGTLLAVSAAMALAVTWVDPFGERESHGPMKTFASNVLTADKYLHQLQEGPHILVFGTSRSRHLSSELVGEPVINLHAIYGNPHAVKGFLDRLNPQQIKNIRRVIYLLDGHTFDGKKYFDETDYKSVLSSFIYRVKNTKSYISNSISKIKYNYTSSYASWIDDTGATHNINDPVFTGYMPKFNEEQHSITQDNLILLKEIDSFFKNYGIDVSYVRPPLPMAYLHKIDQSFILDPVRIFSNTLPDGIYDLTYTPGVSENNKYFWDETHLNMVGTAKVFPSGYPIGTPVKANTLNAHLKWLAEQCEPPRSAVKHKPLGQP